MGGAAKKRVLVVEDEPIVAMDLKRTVESFGYEVTATVASADEAIQSAEANLPDVVLMDVHLEGTLDGVSAADLLRNQWGIPIIFITAYADERTTGRARHTEPAAYLLKPLRVEELRVAIELALHRRSPSLAPRSNR